MVTCAICGQAGSGPFCATCGATLGAPGGVPVVPVVQPGHPGIPDLGTADTQGDFFAFEPQDATVVRPASATPPAWSDAQPSRSTQPSWGPAPGSPGQPAWGAAPGPAGQPPWGAAPGPAGQTWAAQPDPAAEPQWASPSPSRRRWGLFAGFAAGAVALVALVLAGATFLPGLVLAGPTRTTAAVPTGASSSRTSTPVPTLTQASTQSIAPPTTPVAPVTVQPRTQAPAYPTLTDLQPGIGQRMHQVLAAAPGTLAPGESVVVWISARTASGLPNQAHIFPYAVLAAGESKAVGLDVGGSGTGDIGAVFVAQACTVRGTALVLVNGYLDALATNAPSAAHFRDFGIDLTGSTSDVTCIAPATITLTRTQ